jgi:hypothetical protein
MARKFVEDIDVRGNLSVAVVDPATVGVTLTGAAAQTANYITVRTSALANVMTLSSAGALNTSGNITASAVGSSEASPRIIGVDGGFGAGNAARWVFGDNANAIQNGFGAAMQVYAYYTLELIGKRTTTTPPALVGPTAAGVSIINTVAGNVGLWVTGATSQSADLLQFRNVGGTVLAQFSAAGALTVNAANGVTTRAAVTQDAVILAGRAGGTSSYGVTITPTTLTGSQTLTAPDVTGTLTVGTGANTQVAYWTGANTLAGSSTFTFNSATGTLGTNYLQMNIAAGVPTQVEGLVFWDATDHALSYFNDITGTSMQLGTELWVRGVNKTGATLTDGTVVFVSGAQGNRPTITKAYATLDSVHSTIGVVTADILDNAEGNVTTFGLVRGYDTSGFAAGDPLYISAVTPGLLTNVRPVAPNHAVRVGYALNSTIDGLIMVDVDIGSALSELHDVVITSAAAGDFLRHNGTVWVDSTLQATDIPLTATYVGYGSGTNSLTGSAAFTFNAGTATLSLGTASSLTGVVSLANAGTANLLGLRAGATSASYTLTFPAAAPSVNGQSLLGNTDGTLTWVTPVTATGTVNVIPKVTNATGPVYGDSAITDSGSRVTIAGRTMFVWNSSNTPTAFGDLFEVTADTGSSIFSINLYTDTPGTGPGNVHRRARGTIAAPVAVSNGDLLATFGARQYYTGAWAAGSTVAIQMWAAEDATSSSTLGTFMSFQTTAVGGSARREVARISADGSLVLGYGSALTGTLSFSNSSNANRASLQSGTTSSTYTLTLPTALPGATAFLTSTTGGTLGWDTSVYLTSTTGHYQQGFENQTDATMSFVPATRVFTITPTSGTFRIYRAAVPYDLTAKTVTLPNTTGLYFITLDGSNNLVASTTPWSIITDIPVATVYYYAPTTVGAVVEERHGARRNRDWHQWAHYTLGTRYESGGTGTFGNTSLSVTTFKIHDEDIVFTSSGPTTNCRVWRYSSANTAMFFSVETVPYLVNAGTLQYDNNGTPTNVTNNNYIINDVYGVPDSTVPVYVRVGTAQYGILADAQAVIGTTSPWINVGTAELKLLYQVIYRNQAGTPTFIQATDFRTTAGVPGGGTGIVSPHAGTHAGTGSDPITSLGAVTFTGTVAVDTVSLGTASTTTGVLTCFNSGNANTVSLQAGATSASYSLTLPTAQGGASTVLQNNGSGVLSWATLSATIGGSIASGQVAYGSGTNTINGSSKFLWDNTNGKMTIDQGSISTLNPAVDITTSWAGGVDHTGIQFNATLTSAGASSNLMALKTAGTTRFQVGLTGSLAILENAVTGYQPLWALRVKTAAHTNASSGEWQAISFDLSSAFQYANAPATQRAFHVVAPVYRSVNAGNISNAATFSVSGAPSCDNASVTFENTFSVWVQRGILGLGTMATEAGQIRFNSSGSQEWVTLKSGSVTSAYDLTLPVSQAPSTNAVMVSSTAGVLSWIADPRALTATYVGFGSAGGLLTGSANITWNDTFGGLALSQVVGSGTVPNILSVTGAAMTALTTGTEFSDVRLNLARTVAWAGSTAISNQRAIYIQAPTYSAGTATTMNLGVTLAISGAPAQAGSMTITFPRALLVESGVSEFKGKILSISSIASSAYFNIPHGAQLTSGWVNGDFWTTSAGYFGRVNGVTVPLSRSVNNLTDATTIAVDAGLGTLHKVTLTASRTMGVPTNAADGSVITFKIQQGGSGSYTITWDAVYQFSTNLPAPVLSTAVGSKDYISFAYDSSAAKWHCISYVLGYT